MGQGAGRSHVALQTEEELDLTTKEHASKERLWLSLKFNFFFLAWMDI